MTPRWVRVRSWNYGVAQLSRDGLEDPDATVGRLEGRDESAVLWSEDVVHWGRVISRKRTTLLFRTFHCMANTAEATISYGTVGRG